MKMERRTGYMCKIDFLYDLGNDIFGSTVFPTIEAVPPPHNEDCGIVKVEVRLLEIVKEESSDKGIPAEEVKKMEAARAADPEYQEYLRLREKFDTAYRHAKNVRSKKD